MEVRETLVTTSENLIARISIGSIATDTEVDSRESGGRESR